MKTFLFATLVFASATALTPASAQPADTQPFVYKSDAGLMLLSPCASDGKFVATGYTAAFVAGDEGLERWFSQIIASRLSGWGDGMPAVPTIRRNGAVLSAAVQFRGHGGQWRAWFYAVARGNRAQWAVILAPSSISPSDQRIAIAQNAIEGQYAADFTLMPEALANLARPAVRPNGARDEIVGRLQASPLKYLLAHGPDLGARDYLLMRDGFVLEVERGDNSYLSVGQWKREGRNYKIVWGTGEESAPDVCFRPGAAGTAGSGQKTVKPGCRMEPRTITTFTTRSSCDAQGRNCTTQSVPQQTTVMQEQCD